MEKSRRCESDLRGRLGQGSEGEGRNLRQDLGLSSGDGAHSAPPVTRWVENWWLTAWEGLSAHSWGTLGPGGPA